MSYDGSCRSNLRLGEWNTVPHIEFVRVKIYYFGNG